MRIHPLRSLCLACLGLCLTLAAAAAPVAGLKPTDRILFIGDSITGQGAKFKQGYVNLFREAIAAAHPDWQPTYVPLGGSGHSVSSWAGLEKRSRETEQTLDLPEFGVKAALDQPADVVVILLGMNDILAPYVSEQPAVLEKWAETYRGLVTAVRDRTKPRLIGLATITLNTDDLRSPKNRLRAELNARIAGIARTENCLLLPTGEEMEFVLQKGRTRKPDFHPTVDFVHPNTIGHAAIAHGMLKGLGEVPAAEKLTAQYYPAAFTALALYPALSYTLEPVTTPLAEGKLQYGLRYWWAPDAQQQTPITVVTLQAPAGWQVTPATQTAATGLFTLTGTPDRLVNTATLSATAGEISKAVAIPLPAPWLIGSGVLCGEAWPGGKFTAEKAKLPFEEALAKGEGVGEPQTLPTGQQLTWARYQASVDYTGGTDPASLDFVQVSFGKTFEVAYAARWIYSPIERPVAFQLGVASFATTSALTLYLNGASLYAKTLTAEPGRKATVEATLTKGWNLLLLKSNHYQWQWHTACKLVGVGADDLGDLRFSATPKAPPAP
jgi:lysophospholipase L1-like esterase